MIFIYKNISLDRHWTKKKKNQKTVTISLNGSHHVWTREQGEALMSRSKAHTDIPELSHIPRSPSMPFWSF